MQNARTRDEGFTLVELVVYSVLLILMMGIAATLFIQMLTVQREVGAMADASNSAQLTFAELERDLRNAGTATISDTGSLLVMRTRTASSAGEGVDQCVGYFIDDASASLRRTTNQSDTSAALSAGNAAALAATTTSWPVARADMSAVGASRAFGPADQTYGKGGLITIALEAQTVEGRKPVILDKAITLRPQSDITNGCE
ncbi:PulJ/GspJ family protein [Demequina sp. SO4-18]|uniref:PulJ/GspJ family protein n=1 Tax=Demequina sp. SO4-18 TaxID=3401026 RepID=UPI003B5A8332